MISQQSPLIDKVLKTFQELYKEEPIITRSPGRINIIGEHTDYNEGFVLPAAIDRHIAVALRLRRDPRIALRSDRYQANVELDTLPTRRQGNWADYLVGI